MDNCFNDLNCLPQSLRSNDCLYLYKVITANATIIFLPFLDSFACYSILLLISRSSLHPHTCLLHWFMRGLHHEVATQLTTSGEYLKSPPFVPVAINLQIPSVSREQTLQRSRSDPCVYVSARFKQKSPRHSPTSHNPGLLSLTLSSWEKAVVTASPHPLLCHFPQSLSFPLSLPGVCMGYRVTLYL